MTVQLIVTIIFDVILAAGIATPLVIKLIQYIKESIKEKNWNNLVKLLLELITKAETLFENGAERKEWVIEMVKTSEKQINFDIDEVQLSELIDELVEMTKQVNVKK